MAIDRAAFAQSSETVKVALIGCGGRGSGAANQALSTNGDVKLVAMADAFKDRMDSSQKGLQRAHGLKVDVKDVGSLIKTFMENWKSSDGMGLILKTAGVVPSGSVAVKIIFVGTSSVKTMSSPIAMGGSFT